MGNNIFCANKAKNLVKEFRLKEAERYEKEAIDAKLCAEKDIAYIFNLIADAAKNGEENLTYTFKPTYRSVNYNECYAKNITEILSNFKYKAFWTRPFDVILIDWRDD